nr:MAG TPA: hypothetical protein [Caudoviricetes sp.]
MLFFIVFLLLCSGGHFADLRFRSNILYIAVSFNALNEAILLHRLILD